MKILKFTGREGGQWAWVAAGGLLVAIILLANQGYASSITVTADPLPITTTYPGVFAGNWTGPADVRPRKATSNLVGSQVTTVTVTALKNTGGAKAIRVELKDASGMILSQGCAATPGGGAKTVTVSVDVTPDVTYSGVNSLNAVGIGACP